MFLELRWIIFVQCLINFTLVKLFARFIYTDIFWWNFSFGLKSVFHLNWIFWTAFEEPLKCKKWYHTYVILLIKTGKLITLQFVYDFQLVKKVKNLKLAICSLRMRRNGFEFARTASPAAVDEDSWYTLRSREGRR